MPCPAFSELLGFYEDHLRGHVMPFWTRHCVDWKHGGLNTCVADDGTLVSTDKYLMSQGRALWTFSALHNHFNRDGRWLAIAQNIAAFLIARGRDQAGRWVYCLHQDGRVADPSPSIYVDAFMILGLTEYARASGDRGALAVALETFARSRPLLDDHSTLPSKPLRIPSGTHAHGPFMVFTLSAHELGVFAENPQISECARELAERIITRHLKPEHKLLFEFVRPDGEWQHNLDRHGRRIPVVAKIPVKDPFHLPRALLYAILALRKLSASTP